MSTRIGGDTVRIEPAIDKTGIELDSNLPIQTDGPFYVADRSMTRDRYQDAARLLGAKYRRGMPGVRAARVWGTVGDVDLEFTWIWVTETSRGGLLGRKKIRDTTRRHAFRYDLEWVNQPMTITYSQGNVMCSPAITSEISKVTPEQMWRLADAFSTWPDLRVTNHGFEWTSTDTGQTAQELTVTVQAMCQSLQSLVPEASKSDKKQKSWRPKNPLKREASSNPPRADEVR